MSKTLILIIFSFTFLFGCKEGTGLLEAKSDGTTSSSGGSGGGSSSPSLGLHADNPTFEFIINDFTGGGRSATDLATADLPTPSDPSIDTSSMITSISVPTTPTGAKFVPEAISGTISNNHFDKVDLTATQVTHEVKLDAEVSDSCSSTNNLVCEIDSTDATLLNLTEMDMSEFNLTTTNFVVTADGVNLNIPSKAYEVKLMQQMASSGAIYTFWPKEVVHLDGYYYVMGLTSVSGSQYNDLYRFSDSDGSGQELTRSVSTNTHKMRSLFKFNGKLYFSASTGLGDKYFYEYDPSSNTYTNLSTTAGELRDVRNFAIWNSKLYISARDSNGSYQLYSMTTAGSLKKITDVCSGGDTNSIERMIPTTNGLYMGILDPVGCSNVIVGRLNSDETFTPLISASSNILWTTSGILDAKVHNGVTFFNAGTTGGETLYRDNMDGTVDHMTPEAFSSNESTKNVGDFEFIGDQIYYRNVSSNGPLYRLDLITGLIHILMNSVNLYQVNNVTEIEYFNDQVFFVCMDGGNNRKVWRVTGDNNIEQVLSTTSGSDLPEKLTVHNNKLYLKVKTSSGDYSLRMIDMNNKVKAVFIDNFVDIFATDKDVVLGNLGNSYDIHMIRDTQ